MEGIHIKLMYFCFLLQEGKGYVKPLRDITFYKESANTETIFNGKPVVLKVSIPVFLH